MKREIKFKSYWKHEETGEIGTGFHEIRIDGRSFSAPSQQSNYRDLVGFCQSTGLKDNNGVDIYEGDIVKRLKESGAPYQVIWQNGGFRGVSSEGDQYGPYTLKLYVNDSNPKLVVIGNIHQHPHLITGDRADTGEK